MERDELERIWRDQLRYYYAHRDDINEPYARHNARTLIGKLRRLA